MSDGLMLRDESVDASVIAAAMSAVRRTEGERKLGRIAALMSGWLVAAALTYPLIQMETIIRNRPVPHDRIWVSFVDVHGMPIAEAKPAEDLDPSQRESVIMNFMTNYVTHRLQYTWEEQQHDYDWVRFTTYGPEQLKYINDMTISSGAPSKVLGKSGTINVTWTGTPYRTGPNSFDVLYKIQLMTKDGAVLPEQTRRATIAYSILDGMPAEIAHRLDPLKVVVTRWTTEPAEFDASKLGAER